MRSRSFLVRVESPDRNRSRGSFFFTVLGELDTIATGVTRHHHRRLCHPAVYLTVAPAAAALRHPRQRCRPRRRRPHLRRRDVLAAPPTAPSPTASPHRRRPRFSPPTSRSPTSARCARRARCSPRPRPALLALALRNRRLLQICVCVRMCTRRPSRGSSATSRSRARTSRRDRCAHRTRLCAARLRAVVRGRCVSYPHRDHTVPVCAVDLRMRHVA